MGANGMVAETVNRSGQRKGNQWINYLRSSNLSEEKKIELFQIYQNRQETINQAWVFMKAHPEFDDLQKASQLLNNAKCPSALGLVEVTLQRQIDKISKMSNLNNDDKSRCLYTLQNLILRLNKKKFENGQKNDFMPKILQDYFQMTLKASMLGLKYDDKAYSNEYHVANEDWRFLDLNLIRENMKYLSGLRAKVDVSHQQNTPKISQPNVDENGDSVFDYKVEKIKVQTEGINQILSDVLTKFDPQYLKNHLPEFFNFVKDSLNQKAGEVDYPVLHKAVLAIMHRVVEIGNEQQKIAMMQSNKQTGRSL